MALVDLRRLEDETRAIGEEIFQRAEDSAPSAFSMEHWQQRAMEWMTRDEDLKSRLFRFVECLPGLPDHAAVAGRLKELLKRDENGHGPLPTFLQLAVAYHRDDSLFASLVASLARWGCLQSARQFICGSTPNEALASVLRMRREGMAFTLDLLGETVDAAAVARSHLETYVRLIRELGYAAKNWASSPILDEAPWGPIPRVNISCKLTALVVGIETMGESAAVEAMAAPLRLILQAAREHGVFINVDMEHHAIKEVTLQVFRRVLQEAPFRDWSDCGIVIQAYLRDAMKDLADLIEWTRQRGTPISVRLVKGAYWDSETAKASAEGRSPPVFTEKWQSDESFEGLARTMVDHWTLIRPAIGSHNVRSIAATLAYAGACGLPPRTVEVQMLTGMGDPLKRAIVAMKQRLRVYAPFGDLVRGMAYLIRRLIENTSNESFLRQSFSGGTPRELLLENPSRVRS